MEQSGWGRRLILGRKEAVRGMPRLEQDILGSEGGGENCLREKEVPGKQTEKSGRRRRWGRTLRAPKSAF